MYKSWICFALTTILLSSPLRAAAAEDIPVPYEMTDSTDASAEITPENTFEFIEETAAPESIEGDAAAEEALEPESDSEEKTVPTAVYATHVQTYGWTDPVTDGEESGTTGESKRLEGICISLENSPCSGSIQYCTHVQTYGWQDWRADGDMAGTQGESKRLEAIQIRLTGELETNYNVWYQTHIQNIGWTGWAMSGEPCGSAGYSYRLEAIRILILPKDAPAPGAVTGIFFERGNIPENGQTVPENTLISYSTHVQSYGWQNSVSDGAVAGTAGESKRLEGICISLGENLDGGIRYCTHVQTYGWQDWKENGQAAGTTGESKRLEAICIELTGAAADSYDVYYRVHCQTLGWMAWTKNGQNAGTAGMGKRLEAIQILLMPKNAPMPDYDPDRAFRKQISGSAVTWIGDSYSAINRNVIETKLPGVDVQAQSSKFISSWGPGGTPGIPLTAALQRSGQLRSTVVFALGTNSNDGITQDELNQLRNLFGDSYKVVFVTARTNRSLYASGNALLRSFVNQYPNYYLYDWDANFYPSYLLGDGVHPNSTGINVWVDGIINTLNSTI